MVLNFRIQKQILDNWCWAAVTSSISFYFDNNSRWRQGALAAHLINPDCGVITHAGGGAAPGFCDRTLDLARSLKMTGNFAGDLIRALSLAEVVNQINEGYPVCCQIVFPGSDTSHFVVIYGYQSTNLQIGDPQAGIFSIPYDTFLAGYRGGRWRRTIGTRKRPDNI